MDGGDRLMEEAPGKARAGRGASALVDAEQGILAHLERLRRLGDDQPFDLDMALALTRHAEVLHRFGDPDLAVAAADLALRTYLNRRDEIGTLAGRVAHVPAFARAAAIATDIHRAAGRLDIARSAEGLGRQVAPDGPAPDVGRPEPLLDRVTLAQAFLRVSPTPPPDLRDQLTAPATDCSLIHTTQRCTTEDLPVVAGLLAMMAEGTIGRDVAAGLRLGLEAHVLYAQGSEDQLPALRYQFGDHGPPWARTLLLCSRACEQGGRRELALDLASWMAGVVNQLMPFALTEATTRPTVRDCISWHATLLDRSGDPTAAADARQAVTRLDTLP